MQYPVGIRKPKIRFLRMAGEGEGEGEGEEGEKRLVDLRRLSLMVSPQVKSAHDHYDQGSCADSFVYVMSTPDTDRGFQNTKKIFVAIIYGGSLAN